MSDASVRALDTYGAHREALHEVIAGARQSVVLLDPDLRHTGLESAAGIEHLQAFCLAATREDAVRILVHSPTYIERDCPRLLELLFRFRHRMGLRIISKAFRAWSQPFCIVDGVHSLTRFHQDGPRGRLCLNDPTSAGPLLAQFDTIWIAGRNGPTGAPLGI